MRNTFEVVMAAAEIERSGGGDAELRVLMLEDTAIDAELCESELRAGGLEFTAVRVQTRRTFENALETFAPDLIISDFSLPGAFDGLAALDIVRSRDTETPFVFVSGTIGEERAVEAMRRGATDYVLKDKLERLFPVITRALKERAERVALQEAQHTLGEVRQRMERILASLRDVVWSMAGTPPHLLYLNPAAEELYGRPVETLLDDPSLLPGLIVDADRDRVSALWQRAFDGEPFECEYRIQTPRGVRWVQDRGNPVRDADGRVARLDGVTRDITTRRQNEVRIARLSRMRAVSSGINGAIVRVREAQALYDEVCRIAVEDGGFLCAWIGELDARTRQVSARALRGTCDEHALLRVFSGSSATTGGGDGLIGVAVRTGRLAYAGDPALDPALFACSANGGAEQFVAVLPLATEDATAILCLYSGEAAFFDADELKLLREIEANVSFALASMERASRLDYLAYYDVLTGLANRRLFTDRVEQLLARAAADHSSVMVLTLDLERFRSINETFGMAAGDTVLKAMGERLKRATEGQGTAARLNADVFALAVPAEAHDAAVGPEIVARIAAILQEPIDLPDERLLLQVRFGGAVFPSDGTDASTLTANSEAALKKAKAARERFLFYARDMNARVAVLLKLENQLMRALQEDEFVLHYQPRVLLMTQEVVGAEALLRWQSPELGIVSPADFIPLLEETGLILDVGRWVLERAAADAARWRARGRKSITVGINVSAIQLRQKDFVEQIVTALRGRGQALPFEIELTESMIMSNLEDSAGKLRQIREAGIKIAIDDFGTGYSSLSYLVKLPLDTLKVDRSFVTDMASSAEHMAIVRTVLLLAESLRLRIVAEGIETAEQASMLRILRCDEGQGYLFGRPVPADAFERMLPVAPGAVGTIARDPLSAEAAQQ
jgi:diguanylate cyclase (GGDEF)-like protein/PAS domain S-box-containing protein